MIRKATIADVPALIELGREFAAVSPYNSEYSEQAVGSVLETLIVNGVVLVYESSGSIYGGLLGMLAPVWFSLSDKIAVEVAWWVAPQHRGGRGGIGLIRAFELWAKESGAVSVALSDILIDNGFAVGGALSRMGYTLSERTHTKEI